MTDVLKTAVTDAEATATKIKDEVLGEMHDGLDMLHLKVDEACAALASPYGHMLMAALLLGLGFVAGHY